MCKGAIMAKQKIKVDIKDPRAAFVIGALVGMVLCTAPRMIGTLLLLGGIVLTVKLVEVGRL